MILRHRSKPLPLQLIDAAIPRLPQHSKFLTELKKDAKIRQQGYNGEIKVDYFIDSLAPKYTILHDVYLRENGRNFQIDSLVIADHSIFIVDSKNYTGSITFNTILKQLTRNDGKVESGYEYPITQVENQSFHLQNWLVQHKVTGIPIYGYVAIADPSTIIKVEGNEQEIAEVVAHGATIPKMIMDKDGAMGRTGKEKLQAYQIGKIILRECREFNINMFKHYGMRPTDILPGVICPECKLLGMSRVHSSWECKRCGCHSRTAHLNALSDYFLLVNDLISNSECMRFLGLNSRHAVSRILKNSNLIYYPHVRKWGKPEN